MHGEWGGGGGGGANIIIMYTRPHKKAYAWSIVVVLFKPGNSAVIKTLIMRIKYS